MSKHLKRFFAPKSWKIKRKGIKFVAKPSPGPHKMSMSMPLNVILRDILGYATTNREVKIILENKNVTIDGIKRNDRRFPVGLFDTLSLNDTNEHYRVVLNKNGEISFIKISKDETGVKLCKITGKSAVKGKIQLNLHDGKNIFAKEGKYDVGDAVLLSLGKKNEVKEKVALDKNAMIYLTGGKHIGQTGKVQDMIGNRILYKAENGESVETAKEYAFPIGKDKPLIKITL